MGERSTLSDFKLMGKLGQGTYGTVFKVVRKLDSTTYAMKEIDLTGLKKKEQEECVHEVNILAKLDNDFIIKYYDCFVEHGKLYIITEYCQGGNLHEFINKAGKGGLPEDVVWRLLIQTALALRHMHSMRVLHRDIKTLNIFLGAGGTVKLGDLGVAKVLSTQTSFAHTVVGTPYYLSPELCSDKEYDDKSDMWAFGVVLYECCTGQHPFDADNQGALIMKILRGKYKPLDATSYSEGLRDIVKRCLTLRTASRPSADQVLALPAVRKKAQDLHISLPAVAKPTSGASAHRPSSQAASRPAAESKGQPKASAPASAAAPVGLRKKAASSEQAMTSGKDADATPPPEGVIRVVGDADDAAAAAVQDLSINEAALPDVERKAVAAAVQALKQAAMRVIGTDAFDRLYQFMKDAWQRGDTDGATPDLSDGIFKIITHDQAEVVTLMYKILFQEDAVGRQRGGD